MCGQAGIILGRKRRSAGEREELVQMFTQLLILNEARGHHATGIAKMQDSGHWAILKDAVRARDFIGYEDYWKIVESINDKTTLVAGHTRWATQGKPENNRNNHPIMVGSIIGTHNGTITNPNQVAKTLGVPRRAEVDSEVIFRIANSCLAEDGVIDLDELKEKLFLLRGKMSSVLVSKTDPTRVIVLKGTKPLSVFYSKRVRALVYSSELLPLEAVLIKSRFNWKRVELKTNSCLDCLCGNPLHFETSAFEIQKELPVYSASSTRNAMRKAGFSATFDNAGNYIGRS